MITRYKINHMFLKTTYFSVLYAKGWLKEQLLEHVRFWKLMVNNIEQITWSIKLGEVKKERKKPAGYC